VSALPQTTTGFLDALANYLESVGTLALTKGTNLFAENMVDDPERLTYQLVLHDEGNAAVADMRLTHLNWTVRLSTSRKVRLDAAEALRPVTNYLANKRRLRLTSDAGDRYQVIATRMVQTPDVTDRLESGYFLATASVQFQVVPL